MIPFVFADGSAAGSVPADGWVGLSVPEPVFAGSLRAPKSVDVLVNKASVTQKIEDRFFMLHPVQLSIVRLTKLTKPETEISYALLRGNASGLTAVGRQRVHIRF